MKSGPVGELPEATNESLCEDIVPPWRRRCLRKFWGIGERWVFAFWPYPFFRRLAPWPSGLGCRSAKCADSLDTDEREKSTVSFEAAIAHITQVLWLGAFDC